MNNQIVQSGIDLILGEVRRLETELQEYKTAKYSMLVNYGKTGRKTDGITILDESISLWSMIEVVLTHYRKEIDRLHYQVQWGNEMIQAKEVEIQNALSEMILVKADGLKLREEVNSLKTLLGDEKAGNDALNELVAKLQEEVQKGNGMIMRLQESYDKLLAEAKARRTP